MLKHTAWCETMDDEIDVIQRNNDNLFKSFKGMISLNDIIGVKEKIYKIEHDIDVLVECEMIILVGNGQSQQPVIDYKETCLFVITFNFFKDYLSFSNIV
jgi:hypothetical protein